MQNREWKCGNEYAGLYAGEDGDAGMMDMKENKWYSSSYRRNLVDMHVEDWDESFMSRFDPVEYVQLLKRANVKSAMIYANSHVGYCYWPIESGKMHRGLKGRDIL